MPKWPCVILAFDLKRSHVMHLFDCVEMGGGVLCNKEKERNRERETEISDVLFNLRACAFVRACTCARLRVCV